MEVTGFFFNPNIHPLLEWRRRADRGRDVAEMTGVEMLVDDGVRPGGLVRLGDARGGAPLSPLHRAAARCAAAEEAAVRDC